MTAQAKPRYQQLQEEIIRRTLAQDHAVFGEYTDAYRLAR